jgi:hypothetical protein
MKVVNLFDNTFRHAAGSVAGKPPTKIRWVRDNLDWDGTTVFVDGYAGPGTVRRVQSKRKVGWLHEPPCLHPQDYAGVDWEGLDLVLTYYEPFLAHPKARLVPYGGVWIPRDRWGMRPKTGLCSFLFGAKDATEGHRIRPRIADAVDVDFYGARGEPVGYGWQAKEKVLADYAFSIVVETCWEPNLFTEWLLDCFAVGTVPILWGCPNYGLWFNAGGILSFETPEEAAAVVQGLSLALYRAMRPAVEENLEAVGQFEITDDWVAEAL